jgi:hypothetical protein
VSRGEPGWVVMPVVNGRDMTVQAIEDCLAQQGVETRVLVVCQGDVDFRQELEEMAVMQPRLLVWSHNPQLPSLSATWNRALRFCWEAGAEEALVVNNDVRVHVRTYQMLRTVLRQQEALFVSAVGVREKDFHPAFDYTAWGTTRWAEFSASRGGPDFSCFLLSRECHQQYPFDEHFIPAYCEDLDYHRRLMLAGDGQRIFSVNLPYLHYASQTVQAFTPEQRAAWGRMADGSRRYYARKWGGPVNAETYVVPFGNTIVHLGTGLVAAQMDGEMGALDVTTPTLQRRVQAGEPAIPVPAPLSFGEEQED